jgi:alkylation response protein AidB-like acyl-CoA dehydrogenase
VHLHRKLLVNVAVPMLSRCLLRHAAAVFSRSRRNSASMSSMSPGICTVLGPEEAAIRDSAAKFARDVLAPNAQRMDRDMKIDPAVLKAMFSSGFMGIEIPSQFGGADQTFVSSCIVIEEFAKADATLSGAADIQNTLINTAFRKFASPAQQERYLPRCCTPAPLIPRLSLPFQACH